MNSVIFRRWLCFFNFSFVFLIKCTAHVPEVNDVVVISDFFNISLSWKFPFPSQDGFIVECCEAYYTYGQRACVRVLTNETETYSNKSVATSVEKFITYNAQISGLTMATKYEIKITNFNEIYGKKNVRWIYVSTKGFSARIVRCTDDFTELEIDTGPYFGGRVGVEDATDARCRFEGDPTSRRSQYLLLISHQLCGSKEFKQYVVSVISIDQFQSVITKSSRRFKVVCDLLPDPFKVQAQLNLTSGASQRDAAQSKVDQLSERGYEDSLYHPREAVDFVPVVVVGLLLVVVVLGVGIAFAWATVRTWRKRASHDRISPIPEPHSSLHSIY